MNDLKSISNDPKGFTLVEVIATLVAAGILGAIFIQFMGTALDASWNSVEIVRDEARAEAVMERIIADYVEDLNSENEATNTGALANIVTNYDGQVIEGITITTEYIEFTAGGDELIIGPPATSDNLKVVLQPPGQVSPAVRSRHPLTTVLTYSRTINDPIVPY